MKLFMLTLNNYIYSLLKSKTLILKYIQIFIVYNYLQR